MKIKHYSIIFLVIVAFISCAKQQDESKLGFTDYNFIVANDLGRNGFYDQKTIAQSMGIFAHHHDIEFVAAAGDIHHFNGVASVTDPLWMTNYELIYDHPELMLEIGRAHV